MPADGHCLFSALLHQLHGRMPSEAEIRELRRRVVDHVEERLASEDSEDWLVAINNTLERDLALRLRYPPVVNGRDVPLETRRQAFLQRLRKDEWGAFETLRAVATLERVNIRVHREAGYQAEVFRPDGAASLREIAVVYRLRPILEDDDSDDDDAPIWNHYDSVAHQVCTLSVNLKFSAIK